MDAQEALSGARPRLLYLITEDWYFWSHRLDLARAVKNAGFEVLIAARVQDHKERIVREGLRLVPIGLLRRSRNPIREVAAVYELFRLYRAEKPDIVHHVALKPILYGSVAARLAGVRHVVNAFAGLGRVFTASGRGARLTRTLVGFALKWVLRGAGSVVILQNGADRDRLIDEGIIRGDQARIIRGSGVNTEMFTPLPAATGESVVMLASRMLWDKGIGEFVDAVRLLKRRGTCARFVLVGRCDEDNPASVPQEQLIQWQKEGVVEWWGQRDDMSLVLASASLVVLPTYYGEGVPKVLLEAASCGKAIVATDIPGCREIVQHRVNGLLVPPKDVGALVEAIDMLLHNDQLRLALGRRGREIVVKDFSVATIAQQMLAVYRELLNHTNR